MSNYSRGDINHWFGYSYLPSKRMIYLGSHTAETESGEGESGTDCQMTEFFIKAMLHLNSISSKPIFIHMNNLGGDYQHGMAIYDAIKLSPSHVYGIAWSYAVSMGSIILQAFDTRIIAPNCVVMIHDGEDSLTGSWKSVEAWAKYNAKQRKMTYEIYLSRMKAAKPRITLEKIEKLNSHDTIFTAQEAVDNGLSDWVLETLDDPYKYYATELQNTKWKSGMKLSKNISKTEERDVD